MENDHEDVTASTPDDDVEEQLLLAQNECTFIWSNNEGCPVGVIMSYVWRHGRDEALYPSPDDFDPDRANLKEHLALGKGIHLCLCAALSRLEGHVVLQELIRRVDTITLDDDNAYEYFPSFMLRGLTSLRVTLSAR